VLSIFVPALARVLTNDVIFLLLNPLEKV